MPDTVTHNHSPSDTLLLRFDEPLEIEVRETDERIIEGRIIPYGQKIKVRGRTESFTRGAVAGIDPASITLFYAHDHQRGELPVGVGVALEEREDGAYARFKVAATEKGDTLLQLVKEKVIRHFSPGFVIGSQSQDGTITSLRSLPEVSLTPFPAYSGAQVLAVRQGETMPEETPNTPAPDGDVEALQTRVSELSATIDRLESSINAPESHDNGRLVPASLTPRNWFYAQVEANFRGRTQRLEKIEEDWAELQTRVSKGEFEMRDIYDELGLEMRDIANITGGATQAGDNTPADDISGLVVEEFMADQLVNVLNPRRPVFANVGSIRMPRSGYAKIPTVTQHTLVAARSGQKQEPNSRKMITTNASFEAKWLDGAVDIALEIIRTADLSVLDLVWNDLLRQYAIATELDPTAGIVPHIEAGAHGYTYTGTALDVTDYKTFVADVFEAGETLEDNSDVALSESVLFPTRAQFRTIASFVDTLDRRIFSTLGPQNADATVGFSARSIQLPDGPVVVKPRSAALTQAVLTSREALKVADGGPERVEALNVADMGRDLGLLGRTMIVDRIPAGTVVFGTDPESS